MPDPYEVFVRWYLRFNGYFGIENFVIHEPVDGVIPQGGEIDVLAVRFPHQLESPGFEIENDEKLLDEEAENNKLTDIVIAEVKGGRKQRLNDLWIEPDPNGLYAHRLKYLISWVGVFSDENSIDQVVGDLRNSFRSQVGPYLFRLVIFNKRKRNNFTNLGVPQITFEEITQFFIKVRMVCWECQSLGVRSAHNQWDPLIKQIWQIGDPASEDDEKVKISKVMALLKKSAQSK